MRKTKIVCTIGPASAQEAVIALMIENGMNVARLNFSHGEHKDHEEKITLIRALSERMGRPVAILQDLAGPKIRVGAIPNPGVLLEAGQDFILTARDIMGTQNMVSVSYPDLPKDVQPGDRLLLADGLMELSVIKTDAAEIQCRVITGGLLTSHKGINLPTGTIQAPPLTAKDREDLLFGLEHNVDYVALSFVKTADDITAVKDVIRQQGKDTPVIAKIEKHEALDHLDNIVDASDGIMVARGDLGVEIPLEEVPLIQKRLIRKANASGKPVITATQMLRSMVNSPRPTRAEAADVVNAVLDGTDAVMLSEETASGDYPVEAVGIMNRLAMNAEAGFPYESYLNVIPRKDIAESIAHASCILADHLDAQAIVTYTTTGLTAMRISRFRPSHPIVALSADITTVRRLTLFWGCCPYLLSVPLSTDDMIERAVLETNDVSLGDIVVIVAGHPLLVAGATNMLRVKKL
ncbi:MAG: pyruvate kinase [Syntrophaceae bacterium]